MIIANPIYDVVFKRLLENESIAKGLLSRILHQNIVELEFQPQEISSRIDDESRTLPITIYRVDFRAKIITEEGEEKHLLIELQKAKLATDIERFRTYLGDQYCGREPFISRVKEDDTPSSLPIVTIYFLNFALDTTFPKVIQIAREYRDAISQERFEGKHDFIECLTHDSYIIQVPKLNDDHQTDLEEALRIFDQRFIIEGDSHLLNFSSETDDPLLQDMLRELEKSVADPKVAKIMEIEDEMMAGQLSVQNELKRERAEKEFERAEKERLAALLTKHGIDPDEDAI